MMRSVRGVAMPLVAAGMLTFAGYHWVRASEQPAPLLPPAPPARSPFAQTLAAAGVVEPCSENIAVGSPLTGLVMDVPVRIGQTVAAGEVLFRLDDRALVADRKVKEAQLAAAEAQLARLAQLPRPEELPVSQAKIEQNEASVVEQEDLLERAKRLYASRSIGEEELIRRRQQRDRSRSLLDQVKAEDELLRAGAWAADLAVAKAEVEAARAALHQIDTELDRLCVRAPIDGTILKLNVRTGEFVASPSTEPLLVMGDLRTLHVRVDIDEHDVPRFRTEARALATVRGDQSVQVPVRFVRVEPYVVPKRSLTGQNTERVDTRVLQAIYSLEPSENAGTFYVGMQMDVFIDLAGLPQ